MCSNGYDSRALNGGTIGQVIEEVIRRCLDA
jgi:hypothetical protein